MDCKHSKKTTLMFHENTPEEQIVIFYDCERKRTNNVNPVTGQSKTTIFPLSCLSERTEKPIWKFFDTRCRPEGRYFEPKE